MNSLARHIAENRNQKGAAARSAVDTGDDSDSALRCAHRSGNRVAARRLVLAVGEPQRRLDIDAVPRGIRPCPPFADLVNGANAMSRSSHELGATPGVRPCPSTELLLANSGMTSSSSVKPCLFCYSQNVRSTKQWWRKKMG